jgi:hypothetical protein
VADKAAAEGVEEELDVAAGFGAVEDGEGAGAKGRGDLARVVAVGAGSLDDERRGRLLEAGEEVEEARAGFFCGGRGETGRGSSWRIVEREAEIDDGDVDWVEADEVGGVAGGGDAEGADAQWLEEDREAIGPGFGLPTGVGKEEVEAAGAGP